MRRRGLYGGGLLVIVLTPDDEAISAWGWRATLRDRRAGIGCREPVDATGISPDATGIRRRPKRRKPPPKRRLSLWVDLRGLEPLTPCMPCRCATSCATGPDILFSAPFEATP